MTLNNGTFTVNPYAFTYTIGNDSQTYGTAGQPGRRPGDHDRHRRQRREPGHHLQQHRRHATAHVGSYAITGTLSNGTGLVSDYTVTLEQRHADGQPLRLHYTIGNDSQTYGTAANLATDLPDHDHYRRQRREPGHRLQQHRRHDHGPRRQLCHHRHPSNGTGLLSDYT